MLTLNSGMTCWGCVQQFPSGASACHPWRLSLLAAHSASPAASPLPPAAPTRQTLLVNCAPRGGCAVSHLSAEHWHVPIMHEVAVHAQSSVPTPCSPTSAIFPPPLVTAVRTSNAERLMLSVRHSQMKPVPPAP